MPSHDIIVIGASAGGVEALKTLVSGLPADLAAALFVVLHFPPDGTSVLPWILSRAGPLPARHAVDGERIKPGCIYIAPPDYHLLLANGRVKLARGPRENGHRPAIDPMFRSAARACGPRVIGVVLSGSLDDGTSGLLYIKDRGGLAVVQDPEDALYPGMPLSAVDNVEVDRIVPVTQMAAVLDELARSPVPSRRHVAPVSEALAEEDDMAEEDLDALQDESRKGTPSVYACPACGGVLFEIEEHDLVHFRCRVGHAYTGNGLLTEQAAALEDALWASLRALEESASLARRLAHRARDRGHPISASHFEEQVRAAEERAATVRRVLLSEEPAMEAPEAAEGVDMDEAEESEKVDGPAAHRP